MTQQGTTGSGKPGNGEVRVLLADDHAVVLDGLSMILQNEPGISVVGACTDSREAVKQVDALQPDIVVVDLAMPDLNGIDASIKMREVCPETKIIILSMHHTSEHIHRALMAGARGYVLKDSAGKEVVEAVWTVHRGSRFLSRKIVDTLVDDYISLHKTLPVKSPIESLSRREREVLQLVVEGKTSKQIAEIICLSPKTVETYRSRLMQKLGVSDMPGLVRFALKHSLTGSG